MESAAKLDVMFNTVKVSDIASDDEYCPSRFVVASFPSILSEYAWLKRIRNREQMMHK